MNEKYLEGMTGNDMVSGQAVRPRNTESLMHFPINSKGSVMILSNLSN